MMCPFCNNSIPSDSDFCIHCGSQLHTIIDDDYEEQIAIEKDEINDYEFVDDDFDEDFTADYSEYDDSYDDYDDEGWGDGTYEDYG